MPRKSGRNKDNINQHDELWQQAWHEPSELDANRKQTLLTNIHDRIDTSKRKKRLFIIGISTAAAILAALFIKMPDQSIVKANPWQELVSGDSTKKILLQDGSVVWLTPHSAIQVSADFSNHRSTMLKHGTAFFSVAKDAQHPFTIAVNWQLVTVVGTAFTIHKLDSVDMQLTVKEGKVALDNAGGRRLFTAGQQVKTSGAISGITETVTPEAADWWLQQQIRLHNISLEELLNRIETYYQVQLSHGTINRKMKVSMTWDTGLSLNENLMVLNALTGYNIR